GTRGMRHTAGGRWERPHNVARSFWSRPSASGRAVMCTVPRSDRLPRYWHAIAASGLLLIVGGCGGGGGGSSSAAASANPMPAISSLAPASATAGAAVQTVVINGSGFISGSKVTYNGVAHTATFVSATQLTIQLTSADQAMAGSYMVLVTNPPPGGGVSGSAI